MTLRTILAAGAAAAALMLAGCGFRPLYGEDTAGSAQQLADIQVEPMPDRIGQQLYTMLLERLSPRGAPDRPDYTLQVTLVEATQDLAERKDASATRSNLIINASYTLSSNDPRNPRGFAGTATSINSYDRVTSEFATLSAQDDARKRGLRTLADEIRVRIAAALENPQAYLHPVAAGSSGQTPQQKRQERQRNTPLGSFLPPRQ